MIHLFSGSVVEFFCRISYFLLYYTGHKCIFVSTYVLFYVHMYICIIYVYIYVCTYVSKYVGTYLCTYVGTYVCMYLYTILQIGSQQSLHYSA